MFCGGRDFLISFLYASKSETFRFNCPYQFYHPPPCQIFSSWSRVEFFTSKCIYRSSGVVWNTFWTHLTTFGHLRKSSKKISRTRKFFSEISKISVFRFSAKNGKRYKVKTLIRYFLLFFFVIFWCFYFFGALELWSSGAHLGGPPTKK